MFFFIFYNRMQLLSPQALFFFFLDIRWDERFNILPIRGLRLLISESESKIRMDSRIGPEIFY